MASTYSSSLRLELMATGDQSGTWGTTTNTNLGTLLEQAITGVLSVAEGDTTLTLTTVNGGSDQARNAVVEVTGAMTANRNVVVQTANKLYLMKNSTTGGFSIVAKTAAGTGVTIPPGTNRWVYSDGTNVVDGGNNLQTLTTTSLSPATTDGLALGTTALMWSDLFLASGGVINWNNGDVTVTHSTNTLAFAGASSGYTFDAVVKASADDAAALGASGTGWSDLFLASGGVINWNAGNVTLTHSAGQLTLAGGGLVLAAGTTSLAPLKLTSGTNLTTATAGVLEYDGVAFYATSVASSRQVVVAYQISTATSTVALSNSSTSAQNLLPSANDVLTLAASTSYRFRGWFLLSTGATSHTTTFSLGGTATFTSLVINFQGASGSAANGLTNNTRRGAWTSAAGGVVTTTGSTDVVIGWWVDGIIRIANAGTIIPQVTFSAGPTGTCQTEPNSYFEVTPIGTDTVAAVGNWA